MQTFMVWINQVKLDQSNDEHVLRGDSADVAYLQVRIQDLEQQIQSASELSRFQELYQILQAFRGIGLLTAMQLLSNDKTL